MDRKINIYCNVYDINIELFIGQPGIRSRFATVNVLVPSKPPTITQGEFILATEGQDIELECVSVGGKPVAEVCLFLFIYLFYA